MDRKNPVNFEKAEAENWSFALECNTLSRFDMRLYESANLAKEWSRWKQALAIYLRANNRRKLSELNCDVVMADWNSWIDNTLHPNDGSVEDIFGLDGLTGEGVAVGEDAAAAVREDAVVDHAAVDGCVVADDDERNRHATRTLTEVVSAFDNYCSDN